MVNFKTRSRAFLTFLKTWLGKNWQLLLSVILGIYLPLQIFAVIALQVWAYESGFSWDLSMLTVIHASAQSRLDHLAAILTNLGSIWTVLPIVTVIAAGLFYQKQWRSLIYLLITLSGCTAINRIAKTFWHRLRPQLWESVYPLPTDFSFPSGHAMTSMVFVAMLIILLWGNRWCKVVWVLGGLYVLTIGWTRLYLGVHYPSDVLAGWMIAIAWAIGVSLLVRVRSQQQVELID